MHKTAVISECGIYRYTLTRNWHRPWILQTNKANRSLVFIGLNPSTADMIDDDPTIRRCIDFAKRWDYDGIIMLNLFSYRSTDPSILCNHPKYVGPKNDKILLEVTEKHPDIIACWGGHKIVKQSNRDKQVVKLINKPMYCLGYTKSGNPLHPLFVPAVTKRIPFVLRGSHGKIQA